MTMAQGAVALGGHDANTASTRFANDDPRDFSRVLWTRTASKPGQYPVLDGEEIADIVVIGAGITGLSSALHLAKRGLRVAVLEAVEPGHGSSGRNAAGIAPVYLDRTPEDVLKLVGETRGGALNQMVAGSAALMRDLIDAYGMDVSLQNGGMFMAAHNKAAMTPLAHLARMWRRYGAKIDIMFEKQAMALTGSSRVPGGLLFHEGGTLNPLSYVRGLAAAAVKEGAQLYVQSPATSLNARGGKWHVTTPRGSVTARYALLATDAYPAVKALWPALAQTYYDIQAAVIASAPNPALVRRLLPGGVPIGDAHKSNHLWLMADENKRLIASLLPSVRDRVSPATVARKLEKKLHRLHPQLPPISWDHYWLGSVAVSANRLPMALRLAPNLHSIGGYCGQGLSTATAAGLEYARFIEADGAETACALPFGDPRPVPLQRFLPALLRGVLGPISWTMDRSYLGH